MANNRQINTGFKSADSQEVILEAIEQVELAGEKMDAGGTIHLNKSRAKQILKDNKGKFRITMA